ncbi:cyclase family protein [Fumia xinanensis]|uniref:Cyclase family protein n=1 Tax=Fumia xinanensis TaxID=2763659 RepID=A0A926I835_9FIRM|nr:cyclase family protein [Fumia xinanensis]MBC8560564.1 cyclase family protein [Fumia xinanensis]
MLYELSLPLSPDVVRYDDATPKPQFQPFTSIGSGDSNNQTVITLFTHGGSHVDAPYHFCEGGDTIDQLNIGAFIFSKALLVNVQSQRGGRIGVEQLKGQEGIENADLLMLHMGYSQFWQNEAVYRDDFPALTLEAARYLREQLPNLKAIALDTLSVDGTDGFSTGFANHHALLDMREDGIRPLLIYECMDFTPILGLKDYCKVYGIPLRLKGLDASPVTMVAELINTP